MQDDRRDRHAVFCSSCAKEQEAAATACPECGGPLTAQFKIARLVQSEPKVGLSLSSADPVMGRFSTRSGSLSEVKTVRSRSLSKSSTESRGDTAKR
jgi:hypothetical protein